MSQLINTQGVGLPKVVCIGGGTGLSTILRGLKKLPFNITAIVTVADDGGSSGRLRSDLQMPPPGDIRNVLLALADTEPLLEKMLQYRFKSGTGLAGHTLGNLIIAAMKEITGDFTQAVQEMSRVLAVSGRVLPASDQDVTLIAEMSDGSLVRGESRIPNAGKKIKRVFLDPPNIKAHKQAIDAILNADGIVIAPGSLYTSILPNLLVTDLTEAIRRSDGLKIFICNIMTQPGETDDFTASDHIQVIYDHIGDDLFHVIMMNNAVPPMNIQEKYLSKNQRLVVPDVDKVQHLGCQVIVNDFILDHSLLRHDADKISKEIFQLIAK